MTQPIEFDATLKAFDGPSMLYIVFPFDVQALFGTRGNVKVKVTYDGVPHRGLLTNRGGGYHFLGLRRDLREKVGKIAGETVHVTIERDTDERLVDVPNDLATLLEANPDAADFFDTLSYTNRKEYAAWVAGAKRPETRTNRLTASIEKLLAGKKNPSEK